MAQANTKSMKKTASKKVSAEIEKEKELKVEKARQNAKNAKPGSLANKANMVERFNKNN